MTADDLIAGNIFLSGRRHIGLGPDSTARRLFFS
jgi:hypothetical protein